MQFQGKALYNLLRSYWLEDRSIQVEPWQVEDYRSLSLDELFQRLKKLKISLDEERFLKYAETCETPEDLLECLWVGEEQKESQDQAYLLLFELWRRLLPHKPSLSLFCDQLDFLIDLYDRDHKSCEEEMQQALKDLEDILDNHVDLGGSPQEIFQSVAELCAHDLQSFLEDYIVEQIESDNELYASELLDGFYPYIPDPKRFNFLRARLFVNTDLEEAYLMIRGIFEQLQEEPDFELLLEIGAFLKRSGDPELFWQSIKQAHPLIRTEGDFQEFLKLIADYYRCLDKEREEAEIQALLHKRSSKPLTSKIEASSDEDFKAFLNLRAHEGA